MTEADHKRTDEDVALILGWVDRHCQREKRQELAEAVRAAPFLVVMKGDSVCRRCQANGYTCITSVEQPTKPHCLECRRAKMVCSYGADLSTTRRGVVRYRGLPNSLMTQLLAGSNGRVTETDSQRESSTIVILDSAPRNAVASSSRASGPKRKHNDDPLELVNERADEITSALETELDRLQNQERQTARAIALSESGLKRIDEQLEDLQREINDLKKSRENRRKEIQQQQTSLEAIRADIAAHQSLSSALDKFSKRPRTE